MMQADEHEDRRLRGASGSDTLKNALRRAAFELPNEG
jgi:hypothetical protein